MIENEKRRILQVKRLNEADHDLNETTPAERLGMVWPITVDVWAFKDRSRAQSRLQRHIVRFYRRAG